VDKIKLSIFSFRDLNVAGGTPIRTLGHTIFLKELGISVDLYSPFAPPKFLRESLTAYHKISIPPALKIFLRFYPHALLLRPVIKYIISRFSLIKKCLSVQGVMVFHQDFSLGFFLANGFRKKCLYDIHGIIDYQREYSDNASIWRKINFYYDILKEQQYFRKKGYFIAPSLPLKLDLARRFSIPKNYIFVGEDGVLLSRKGVMIPELKGKIIEEYKMSSTHRYLLFIGDFKRFGGIVDVVVAFIEAKKKFPELRLFLVGKGQEAPYITKIIEENHLTDENIWIPYIPYEDIATYHSLCDIIICPDRENRYSALNPHIKLYDSLSSGKPILFSYFLCLKPIIKDISGFETFTPGDPADLARKLEKILGDYPSYAEKAKTNMQICEKYNYRVASKNLVNQILANKSLNKLG
jgi:glycosyltransferase involved in cell wall biosynthesis